MMSPIVLPRVSGGTSVMTVVMSSGIMIAVPEAWITRAATSSSRSGAIAAATVPSENSDIAMRKTVRVCRRCIRKPVIGMTTAIVSRNAAVTHCAARGRHAEAHHERRDRDAHDRLVQDHDERRDEQQVDDEAIAARRDGRGGVESRGVHGGAIYPEEWTTRVIFARTVSARRSV